MFWQTGGRRSVWREMERLQREMNRIMDVAGSTNGSRTTFPAINIWADGENAMITAELPGIAADDLDISVVGDTLTLAGSRTAQENEDEGKAHRRERWHGNFSRTVQLPFRIEAEGVDATYQNGILHVVLPRAEADKPKRITIG